MSLWDWRPVLEDCFWNSLVTRGMLSAHCTAGQRETEPDALASLSITTHILICPTACAFYFEVKFPDKMILNDEWGMLN